MQLSQLAYPLHSQDIQLLQSKMPAHLNVGKNLSPTLNPVPTSPRRGGGGRGCGVGTLASPAYLFLWLTSCGNTTQPHLSLRHISQRPKAPDAHQGHQIRINRRPSPSTSVGAGVDEDEGLGRLRRPRPVPLTDILPKHDHLPTPRATIKALPSPHRPPSPLRIAWPPA